MFPSSETKIIDLEKVRLALQQRHPSLAAFRSLRADVRRAVQDEVVAHFEMHLLGRRDRTEVKERRPVLQDWLAGLLQDMGTRLAEASLRAPARLRSWLRVETLVRTVLDRVRWAEIVTNQTVYRMCPHLDSSGPDHRQCVAWLADPLWESRESHRVEMKLRDALRGMLLVFDPRCPFRRFDDHTTPEAALVLVKHHRAWFKAHMLL